MRKQSLFLITACFICSFIIAQKKESGNPIIKGWYADPEAAIFNKTFWIYPTYSAPYSQQVFLDAFSSNDLVHWKNMSALLIPRQ